MRYSKFRERELAWLHGEETEGTPGEAAAEGFALFDLPGLVAGLGGNRWVDSATA